jgi:hypothetical protein
VTVYDSSSPTFSDFGQPAINDGGMLAFRATLDAGGTGIFLGTGAAATPFALSSGPLFSSFSDVVSINSSNVTAFRANRDGGAGGGTGIFTVDGVTTTTIADSSGGFDQFGDPSINAGGAVAFIATLDVAAGGGEGIFSGSDVDADRIVGTGDALFGSTVTGLDFFRGLNDHGDVAFAYALTNGSFGIAVAMIPEPGGLALSLILVSAPLLQRHRRHTSWAKTQSA